MLLSIILFCVPAGSVLAQGHGEYGDAPEGQMAYPGSLIPGTFPTCVGGPSGHIQHAPNAPPLVPNAWFGPTWDLEFDGNAGVCVPPPYEMDECFGAADGDGGLVYPDAWTFDPTLNTGVTCFSPGPPRSLGVSCGTAAWGTDIEMIVHNNRPDPAYINVLADWNRDGRWGGTSFCGPSPLEEWMIKDLLVPPFYHGSMSGLFAASFQIGPNAGFVWFRFVISDIPVQSIVGGFGWDGALPFPLDAGETEDYMLEIDQAPVSGELGDAPEDALAYPPDGVMGAYPTCVAGGGSYVLHLDPSSLYLGPLGDLEGEGNAGNCTFPDYDRDECDSGGDAGLIVPDSWTIDPGLSYVPCPPAPPGGPRPLGQACGFASTGADLDLSLTNLLNAGAYLNVLVDWDRNGAWGGSFTCTIGGLADEHLIVNQFVPAGYSGNLSGLVFQTFFIPSQAGFCWMRVSLTDQPVPGNWDGSGTYSHGETEDYLVEVTGPGFGEYGDAPEGSPAYPSLGVIGFFPTCVGTGPDGFVYHRGASGERIGPARDFEAEGNAGPPCAFPAYDEDECGHVPGGDSGLLVPDAFTIDPAGAVEVPCPGSARPLGATCGVGRIGPDLDIEVTNTLPFDLYFNLLVDWNQDGHWHGAMSCPLAVTELEHLVQNLVIPPFYSGPISGLIGGTPFNIPAGVGYVWTRATLGDVQVPVDWNGAGFFTYGETEDYLLQVASTSGVPETPPPPRGSLGVGPASPNPFTASTDVRYVMPSAGPLELTVFDLAGRLIRRESRVAGAAGPGRWTWDGRDENGRRVPPGLYVVRIESAGRTASVKITKTR